MARVKRGVTTHARHKKVLKQSKGFVGRSSTNYRIAPLQRRILVDPPGQAHRHDQAALERDRPYRNRPLILRQPEPIAL